ncbi:hypothetical protein [Clostridium butyricum]|uniref:hypothetical protein n=1 Tax=Clostridium butyricum TaxID=1492 RepID=UPI002104AA16|nr:hypothetical protein [Clostridium butyricum]MCQ2014679.1 hypothetical protein [Clostridium butyricum]MCQ2026554.1 hypothetical protein [Clostridium butyricum]
MKAIKEDLLEVLKNLRCIDSTGDLQVDYYVDNSIEILKKVINDIETAPEVLVQEQSGNINIFINGSIIDDLVENPLMTNLQDNNLLFGQSK